MTTCQRCMAQPKGMTILVSQARKRARRMQNRGLAGKPDLTGMIVMTQKNGKNLIKLRRAGKH